MTVYAQMEGGCGKLRNLDNFVAVNYEIVQTGKIFHGKLCALMIGLGIAIITFLDTVDPNHCIIFTTAGVL